MLVMCIDLLQDLSRVFTRSRSPVKHAVTAPYNGVHLSPVFHNSSTPAILDNGPSTRHRLRSGCVTRWILA